MKMLTEKWEEVKKMTAADGTQRAIYETGNYRVIVTDADYMPGGLEIMVRPIDPSRYTPEIYVDARFGSDFQSVRIQTTSWGALEISEIDKVVKAYTEAQELAHEMSL